VLFRVFPWRPDAEPADPGGALFVPRGEQGAGRHDNPDHYGAVYLSRSRIAPIAESLRAFRRHEGAGFDLVVEGGRLAVASLDDSELAGGLLDLDDPRELLARELRPSGVATRQRDLTQEIALSLFAEDVDGFEWWSTIEGSWINVTLFAERSIGSLQVIGEPEPLTLEHPVVAEAAAAVGLSLPG
jgi:hypothetical protein